MHIYFDLLINVFSSNLLIPTVGDYIRVAMIVSEKYNTLLIVVISIVGQSSAFIVNYFICSYVHRHLPFMVKSEKLGRVEKAQIYLSKYGIFLSPIVILSNYCGILLTFLIGFTGVKKTKALFMIFIMSVIDIAWLCYRLNIIS